MRNYIIGTLHSQNGIQRDVTPYSSQSYTDGQWMRSYEGVPKKIGGCIATLIGNNTIARSLYVTPQSSGIKLYMGRAPVVEGVPQSAGSITYTIIDINGAASAPIDRTPRDVSFVPNENYVWDFEVGNFIYNGVATALIFAHARINEASDTTNFPIYFGPVNNPDGTPATTPLQPVFDTNGFHVVASGGILYCAPVLIAFGNNGGMTWTPITNIFSPGLGGMGPGGPGNWDTVNNYLSVTNTKIVQAFNTRGSGAPTVLLWSLNSVCRATLTQTTVAGVVQTTFINTVVEDRTSLMSANAVVNYEQQFFWIGADQFYVYNGIVQSLPNTMNNEWFFKNLNHNQLSKVWGVAVPRYKEIWWFYPRGTATECNAVIIYNLEINKWYDNTIEPTDPFTHYPFTRAAGVSATANYPYPIFSDNTLVDNPANPGVQSYPIWTHEKGVDRVVFGQTFPINSYYTTHLIDLWSSDGSNSNILDSYRIVPDFNQTGAMTLTVNTQMYPRDPVISFGPYEFMPTTPSYIDLANQGGICSFTFASNTVGGDYQTGKPLYFYQKGDTLK